MKPLCAALVAALCAVAAIGVARAQDAPRAHVSGAADDPLVERLERELVTAGFVLAADAEARAEVEPDAVRLQLGDDRTRIARDADDASVALVVVETMRARRAAPSGAEAVEAEAPAAPPRVLAGLWAAAGIVGSPGGIDAFLAVAAGVNVRLVEGLYVEAFGAFSVPETELTQRRFDFTFWTTTFGAGLGWSFFGDDELLVLRAGLGLAATLALIDGDRDHWGATPYARVGIGIAPIPELVVRLDGFAGLVLPELDLRFRASWRAGFGLPVLSATLGLEVRFTG